MLNIVKYFGLFLIITSMGASSDSPEWNELHLDHCLVTAISDIELAAQMSGVIKSISVEEGSELSESDTVLKIDDTQASINTRLSEMVWKQVCERAEDNSSLNFAKAAASVAESEYYRALKTNEAVENAISEMQVEKLEMEMKKARIGVEKAIHDRKQAKWDQELREKEWKIALAKQKQHYLSSPMSGTVVKKHKSVGEWVTQGESVFRIVKMDLMRVEGYIDLDKTDVQDVLNKEVTVEIKLAGSRTVTFSGKIVQVTPMVQAGEKLLVKAEIKNKKVKGAWVIFPGMSADMKIQLDSSKKERKSYPLTQHTFGRMLY